MGDLVAGDDGLDVEEVGAWVDEKHRVLRAYLNLQAGPRAGFLGIGKAGAAYIDPFCGPGRGRVKGSPRYVDGSAVVAWIDSVEKKAPFSVLYIADKDEQRRGLCAARLRALNAPVQEIEGDALEAVGKIVPLLNPYGLHFAFLDPYSLGALQLDILKRLASIRRMDMLVHLSAMDFFRNFGRNLTRERIEFDAFAPGWHEHVPDSATKDAQRRAALDYWKTLVDGIGMDAGTEMRPVRNSVTRDLYWLLLVSRHQLAKRFWKIVLDSDSQRRFSF